MSRLYPWQSGIWQQLVNLRQRLPHALLLNGPQGTGKFDLAIELARSTLCVTPLENGLSCGSCTACHLFDLDSHPDFRLIQPEAMSAPEEEREGGKRASREITIDQIRQLEDFTNLSTHMGGYRIVLINPAEAMNQNAANALLKTLEEPGAQLLFILISHKPQWLLPTIISRCLSISIPLPARDDAIAWLEQQAVENPSAKLAAAGFSPLLALRTDTDEQNEWFELLFQSLRKGGQFDALGLAEQLQRISTPAQIIHALQQWSYDLSSFKLTGKIRYFSEYAEYIKKISDRASAGKLTQFVKELQQLRRDADHPLNARLLYESILLSYLQIFDATT